MRVKVPFKVAPSILLELALFTYHLPVLLSNRWSLRADK